ncbi:MAG: hypothetical protein EPN20_07670 [Magnetospirillum sp.]|nr:MAG: hypothetical protein EPN20_07670 [Magnetospirillum sp.]
MSGFETIVPMALAGASTVAGVASRNSAQGAAAEAQAQAAERRNQLIAAQQASQDQQQRNLLEQQQATARAQMGAWGVGGDGGSADAILQGMAQRTADSIGRGDQLAAMKIQNRTNLLTSGSGGNPVSDGLSVFQSFYGG